MSLGLSVTTGVGVLGSLTRGQIPLGLSWHICEMGPMVLAPSSREEEFRSLKE